MRRSILPFGWLFLLLPVALFAQPYHIDKSKPEPRALVLFDDPENEGVKLGSFEGPLEGEAQRFFIKDYSEYQPIDIFLFSRTEGKELEIQLVLATWNDKQLSCNTGSEGYCQLKFRNYGGVGMDIKGDPGAEYTIIVVVGKEVTPEFDSPFYKVSENDLASLDNSSPGQSSESEEASVPAEGGSNNMILYIIAFFLLIIVIFLGMMVFRKNKGANLLLIGMLISPLLQGQDSDSRTLEERIEAVKADFERFKSAHESVQKWQGAFAKIDELRKLKESLKG